MSTTKGTKTTGLWENLTSTLPHCKCSQLLSHAYIELIFYGFIKQVHSSLSMKWLAMEVEESITTDAMSCLQPWKKSNQLLSLTTSCAGLCWKSKMWSACVKQAVWQRSMPRHAKEPCSGSCMQLDDYKNRKGAYHEPLKENWVCLCTPTVWLDSSANEKWNRIKYNANSLLPRKKPLLSHAPN